MAKKLVSLTVNGKSYDVAVDPRELLIHTLREKLRLTGSHIGCETSHCGACTVDFNGKSVKSCTLLTVQADGAEVMTVEGLANDGRCTQSRKASSRNTACSAVFARPG